MFNIHVETLDAAVLNAFSNFFAELAHHAAQGGTLPTGRICPADSPDAGTDTTQATTTAAAVFGTVPAAEVFERHGLTPPQDAAAVFGGGAQTDAAAVFGGTIGPNLTGGAPSIAGAAALATAHAGTPDISTNQTAAQPPAPPSGHAAATVAGQVQAANPVLLDSNGLPWDVRIHAGTRTQNKDNTWKKKKGVEDATVAVVEAELRAALNAPAAVYGVNQLGVTDVHFEEHVAAPPPPAASNVAPPPPNVATPAGVPAPPSTTVQQPAASAAPTTFAELCKYVTGRGLKSEQILAVCNAHGLAGLGLVACRLDLIPSMYAQFSAM